MASRKSAQPVYMLNPSALPEPPQAPEAERALLGAVLMDPECIDEAAEHLVVDDLYDPRNRLVLAAMMDLRKAERGIDPVSLTDHLRRTGNLEAAGTQTYLAKLLSCAAPSTSVRYYAGIIGDKADLRALAAQASETLARVYAPDASAMTADDLAARAAAALDTRRSRTAPQTIRLDAAVRETERDLEDRRTRGVDMTGLSTGFPRLNLRTGGLQAGELTILAGRPGMGKTTAAINLILSPDHAETGILWASPEVSQKNASRKVVASVAGVDSLTLRSGVPSQDLVWKAGEVAEALASREVYIFDEPRPTVAQIAGALKHHQRRGHVELLIVDHLQKLESRLSDDAPTNKRVEATVEDLLALGKRCGVHVILLAQLSRKCEERSATDKRPILSDLQDSGSIEQCADHVWFLYRDYYYTRDKCPPGKRNTLEWIVAKARYGDPGVVLMHADLPTGRIWEQ